jgi:hypothetical protein
LAALLASGAGAQVVREASAPVDRAVTIYRAPARHGGAMKLGALGGFAVITETRVVDLPAGESRLRFSGVADGILPESAIISGLPGGVIEKNQDAALLSPSALMRGAVGREVMLRRTDPKTGKAVLSRARILSAGAEGVVMASEAGNEALRCSGMAEGLGFVGGLDGLSAEPTLSVRTRSSRAVHARVRLTYIAENFDWSAQYIARVGADGKRLDLSGWITLANGNGVSLANAETRIVAGGLKREYIRRFINDQPKVIAQCWPMQRTSDVPAKLERPYELAVPWLDRPGRLREKRPLYRSVMAPAPMAVMAAPIATVSAPVAEQLGDLKLYRVAERTTIAARQMKQTSLIAQEGVPFDSYYRVSAALMPWMQGQPAQGATLMMRSVNDKAHHLGMPLPAGAVVVEQEQAGRVMVLGEPSLGDSADGEKLELALGRVDEIGVSWERLPGAGVVVVTVANRLRQEAVVELRLEVGGGWALGKSSVEAGKVDGVPTVKMVMAGGEARQIRLEMVGP